jgi:sigma-E factor negative regulatory protein RseC
VIEEQARVNRVHDDIAEIVVEKNAACGSCSAKSGCGTSLLSQWFPRRKLTLSLPNIVDAKSGDTVLLGMDESLLQRSSLVLYALPLGGLLVGAIAGERGFQILGLPTELGAVLFGLLGVVATLLFARQYIGTMIQDNINGLRLLRVVRPSEPVVLGNIGMPETKQREGFGTKK